MQDDERTVVAQRTERDDALLSANDPQPQHFFVVREGTRGVGDLQVHRAESRRLRKSKAAGWFAVVAVRGRLGARSVAKKIACRGSHDPVCSRMKACGDAVVGVVRLGAAT